MKIRLSPVRIDAPALQAHVKNKDAITVNGVDYDFSPLKSGDSLPITAFGKHHPFASDIVRDEFDELHFTLMMPHGNNAPYETRFPAAYETPIEIDFGDVPVPQYDGGDA
ncbi:hypothetical protein ACET5X_00630 [Aeromonas veronii]